MQNLHHADRCDLVPVGHASDDTQSDELAFDAEAAVIEHDSPLTQSPASPASPTSRKQPAAVDDGDDVHRAGPPYEPGVRALGIGYRGNSIIHSQGASSARCQGCTTPDAAIFRLALEAIRHYGFSADGLVELINVSENSTFRVDDPGSGRRAALRVHRLGYHSTYAIESELRWIDALREHGVETPGVIAALDGRRVLQVSTSELDEPRNVVMFEWIHGVPPRAEDVSSFRRLGALSARLHQHSRSWSRPAGFTRFVWDYGTTLGAHGRWGRWQHGLGVGAEERDILGRLDRVIRDRLEAYGTGPDRFGLVHADLRLANLLLDMGRPVVIDFDDSGDSWFMYDWGTAVSFIEDHPQVPELQAAWVEGYRSIATLPAADETELPSFVMLRRLLLVAWIGSHHEFAPEAAELGAAYTAGTCELAERFLSEMT